MSRTLFVLTATATLLLPVSAYRHTFDQVPPTPFGSVRNSVGMQLRVAEENTYPTLRIVLPSHPTSDRAIEVIFPEHLTVRRRGNTDANQLFLFQPGQSGDRPLWRRSGRSLEYERNLPGVVHMLARATLEEDGVRFHFRLSNQSDVTYDLIWAPIDSRLTSVFHDVRLERTYVHHVRWFRSARFGNTEPLDDAAQSMVACPVPRLVHLADTVAAGRTSRRYHVLQQVASSRRAVHRHAFPGRSLGGWSFTRNTGNVWSNPELTCQHVDPQAALSPGEEAILETKLLVVRGSLDDVFKMAMRQRDSLKQQ